MTANSFSSIGPGDLLVAPPNQISPPFDRTIVVICMHDSEGSLGFVINRKHHFNLGSLIACDFPHQGVYFGGPVEENSLACLHQQGSSVQGEIPFSDELSLNLDVGAVLGALGDKILKPRQVRFFTGYSGWSPGQLEEEIKAGAWFVTRGNEELVLHSKPDTLWRTVLRKMGGEYALVANFPEDPILN
ncbi:MAG: YqgE/AlgH family protein [Bacteroidota bacterium]|nr:YqgE/AlgH family protein [Bacteroidota bacterium]